MSLNRVNYRKAKSVVNTGFGTSASNYGGRFINKDGSANVQLRGLNFLTRTSWYHTMLALPRWKFLGILFAFFIGVNLLFASLYYMIGIEYLNGIANSGSEVEKFAKAFFFSTQTFTTVGYGHISPNGFYTSALAATEALVGLLSFSIATGLFYGRFSKPTAHIMFSHNALISPYKDGKALMIRLVPFKNTNFTDAEAKVTFAKIAEVKGSLTNVFYTLPLELQAVNSLNLSWTLVHEINEASPLHNAHEAFFEQNKGEFLVYLKMFDTVSSTTVAAQTSYTFDEVVYNAKFEMMYHENKSRTKTVLELNKLNAFKKL